MRISVEQATSRLSVYATGWAKRGPSGIVGTNIPCARETAQAVLEDLRGGRIGTSGGDDGRTVEELLRGRGAEWVDWEGWGRIDRHERTNNKRSERQPREKLNTLEDMFRVARGGDVES